MVELTDFESAEDWLDDQDQQTCICFAARAALRGLSGLGSAEAATLSDPFFANSRAIIISAVAGKMPAADLEKAAEAAARFVVSTSDFYHSAPGSAARYAAYSAAVSDNSFSHCAAFCASDSAEAAARSADPSAQAFARSAAFSSASADATEMEEAEGPARVLNTTLWPAETMPDGVSKDLQRLRQFWQSAPEVWGFWERWYDGFLNGTPLDWDVQLAVASLPDADWEKGPEWVAGKIAEIERNFLSKKAPLAETIAFNPETNRFHAIPLDIAKPDLVSATLSQLSYALEDVLANPSNGLTDKSREVRVAQRTLDKYADDPQQIELNLVSVAVGLRRQMFDTSELPETEENRAFLQTAEDGAIAIRATHPRVAENREILAQQKFVELPDDDKAVLEAAIEPLLLLSEWQIADDFAEDIPALLNTSVGPSGDYAPPLPGVTRTFGRIARVSQEIDKEGLVEKLEKNKAVRATLMASGFASLGALLWPLVQMGLRLFGVL